MTCITHHSIRVLAGLDKTHEVTIMVNPPRGTGQDEECFTPEYRLGRVLELAERREVMLVGGPNSKVQRHLDELQLTSHEACETLLKLEERYFDKSKQYADDPRWHDVYRITDTINGEDRDMYIKFRLNRDLSYIILCSFHPEGWV